MKKILLIEDEQALQKTVGERLSQEGYEIISALDGEIGLNLASAKKPDLILLDLILPKVQGLDVLKKLKETKETKETPVIILTNLEEMEKINKALELGATAYLVKANYSLEELVEKIKNLI
ncbi:MAG: response regulator [Patescibacteria group bacterium]